MTANPLKIAPLRKLLSAEERLELQREHISRGNAQLAAMGRHDVHWVLLGGNLVIEWKSAMRGRAA